VIGGGGFFKASFRVVKISYIHAHVFVHAKCVGRRVARLTRDSIAALVALSCRLLPQRGLNTLT
jgi:hypothetical protein